MTTDLRNNEIVQMEMYIEKCIDSFEIQSCVNLNAGITTNNGLRIALLCNDVKIVSKIKEILKERLCLDQITLESHIYDFYEIFYNIPEELFDMIYMLSKLG